VEFAVTIGASVTPESKTPKRKWEKPEHVVIKVEAELEQSVEKNEVFIGDYHFSVMYYVSFQTVVICSGCISF